MLERDGVIVDHRRFLPDEVQPLLRSRRDIDELEFWVSYPISYIEWSPEGEEEAYRDDKLRILWQPLKHRRLCLGYRIEELERPGKFDPNKARSLGVPEGPLWGQLQRGERVILKDESTVEPSQVLGKPRRGRHLAYTVDTRPCQPLYRLCRDVDIAFETAELTKNGIMQQAALSILAQTNVQPQIALTLLQ